jgi:hypothetical protein
VTAPDFLAPIELTPAHVGLLQGIVTSSLRGLERDLQSSERLPDPQAVRRESAAHARILEGLERGYVVGPDKDAHSVLNHLIAAADMANNYSAVVAEHAAMQGLIHQLEGRRADGS